MKNFDPKTSEMRFFLMVRQIRIIGIAIILSMTLIFIAGFFVSGSYINKEYEALNLITLILCPLLCAGSYFLKKSMLTKVTMSNFTKMYFNATILPFALCELGGIICITTSLFINQNIPYALTGYAVTMVFLLMNFPRIEDYKEFKEQ
jgi:hypothetical protein